MFSTLEYQLILVHRTCIHKYESRRLRDSFDSGSPCAITALTQSPAIDVVAIGFSNGEVVLYDIRADERLMRIFMEESPIRSISFRSGMYLYMYSNTQY